MSSCSDSPFHAHLRWRGVLGVCFFLALPFTPVSASLLSVVGYLAFSVLFGYLLFVHAHWRPLAGAGSPSELFFTPVGADTSAVLRRCLGLLSGRRFSLSPLVWLDPCSVIFLSGVVSPLQGLLRLLCSFSNLFFFRAFPRRGALLAYVEMGELLHLLLWFRFCFCFFYLPPSGSRSGVGR